MTHNSSFQPWPLPSVNPYFPALLVTIYTQKMYHHHPKLSVFTHRNLMVIIWFKLQFHLYNHAMQVPISSIKWKDSTASRRITHYLNWSISPKYSWEDHQFIDYTMSILLNTNEYINLLHKIIYIYIMWVFMSRSSSVYWVDHWGSSKHFYSSFKHFLAVPCSMWDLVPWPGIEPQSPCTGSMAS